MTICCYLDSPVGRLALEADGETLTGVRWASAGERATTVRLSPVLKEARRQLERYFARKLKTFDLPLAARIAMALASGPRAVGTACGRNPIPIIVPCHRVLGSGGTEGGFSGGKGLPTKRKLLALEGVVLL